MQPPQLTGPSLSPFEQLSQQFKQWLDARALPLSFLNGSSAFASLAEVGPDLGELQARFNVADRQEIAFDVMLNARGDLDRAAQAYGLTRDELDVMIKHDPVVVQAMKHIDTQIQADPAAATRLRARSHLDTLLTGMSQLTASQGVDPKDRIAAFKALASVANVEGDGSKKGGPQVGVAVTVDFGVLTPSAMRTATVVEV